MIDPGERGEGEMGTMSDVRGPARLEDLWDDAKAARMNEPERLTVDAGNGTAFTR
jgi:hypothetical protein